MQENINLALSKYFKMVLKGLFIGCVFIMCMIGTFFTIPVLYRLFVNYVSDLI